MQWLDASELFIGFVVDGQISPHAASPGLLMPPYDHILQGLQEGKELVDLTNNLTTIQAARRAAMAMNGMPSNSSTA